jgi:hypothetical protein
MTVANLVTGTVAGFVLVIDPNNEKGKYERIEYSDATLMDERINRLRREDTAFYKANRHLNYDPTEENFRTLYRRDDDGEIEEEFAFDPSGETKVGDAAYKAMCKCGAVSWFTLRKSLHEPTPSGKYTCADCNASDSSIHDHDFTHYDGMQEREY